MTILQALQASNKAAGVNTELQFANISEFQEFVNGFRFDQYPINVVVPFTINGTDLGPPRNKAVLQLQGWMLTQIRKDNVTVRSSKIEEQYMAPMRKLALKFLKSLYGNKTLIDPEVQSITYTIRPEYNFLNQGLFGCSYVSNVPIQEKICYVPD